MRTFRDIFLAGLVVVLVVGYVLWNSRVIRAGPIIMVTHPLPFQTVEGSVRIEGEVRSLSEFRINNRQIFISPRDSDGFQEFYEVLALPLGYNEVYFYGESLDGRTEEIILPIIVKEKEM